MSDTLVQLEDMWRRVFEENTRLLRHYNRELAMYRYYGLEATPRPVLPLLYAISGERRLYQPTPPAVAEYPEDQNPYPVGAGPDVNNHWEVVEPDYHSIGDLLQTEDGSVWCKVETPTLDGSFVGKWVKVT